MLRRTALIAAVGAVLTAGALAAAPAHANGHVGFSVSVGGPGYAVGFGNAPYYGSYYAPAYVAPTYVAPTYYAPAYGPAPAYVAPPVVYGGSFVVGAPYRYYARPYYGHAHYHGHWH